MPSRHAIYWDSCVFIDRLKRRPDRIGLLETVTDAAAAGDLLIVTSVVTLTEVFKLPEIGLITSEQITAVEAFFENPWISIRIVDEDIAKSAADLRRRGLNGFDALHVASALRYKLPVLHTYDGLAADGTIKPPPCLLAFDRAFGHQDLLRIEVPSDPRPKPPDSGQLTFSGIP